MSRFTLILACTCCLLSIPVLPWHIGLVLLLLSIWMYRFLPFVEQPRDARLDLIFRSLLAMTAILSAFSWRAWLIDYPLTPKWIAPLILVLFAVQSLILLLSNKATPPKNAKAVMLAGFFFAAIASIVFFAQAFLDHEIFSDLLQTMALKDKGEWTDLSYLSPAFDPHYALGIFAFATWSLAFGLYIACYRRGERIRKSWFESSHWMSLWFLLVALGILADWSMIGIQWLHARYNAELIWESGTIDESAVYESLDKWQGLAKHGQRKSAAWMEADSLRRSIAIARHLDLRQALLASSMQLVELTPYDIEARLCGAAALMRIGRKQNALDLLAPQSLSDKKLSLYKPVELWEAWVLSQAWLERNAVFPIANLLKPFAEADPIDFEHYESSEKADLRRKILIRYGWYSLYSSRPIDAMRTAEELIRESTQAPEVWRMKGLALLMDGQDAAGLAGLVVAEISRQKIRSDNSLLKALHGICRIQEAGSLRFSKDRWEGKQGNRLYLPGEASLDFIAKDGSYTATLTAWGSSAHDQLPTIEVSINGKKLSEIVLTSSAKKDYIFPIELRYGPNRLIMRFSNDYGDKKQDRNLFLGSLVLNPQYSGKAH